MILKKMQTWRQKKKWSWSNKEKKKKQYLDVKALQVGNLYPAWGFNPMNKE